jgi:exopolysaccharide production protein ExoZ
MYHASNTLLGHEGHLINLDYGTYGVDVFFVISGFIMFYTTYGTDIRPGTFIVKRLVRIFPLYFMLSSMLFVMVLWKPSLFNQESADVLAYLQSVFFIPHWNPRLHDLQPILGPGWTLNYEMFFYVLFAASLFLNSKAKGLLVLPVIGAMIMVGQFARVNEPAFMTYTNPIMLEFCLGIVVATAFAVTNDIRWPAALMLIFGAAAAYAYTFWSGTYGNDAARPFLVGIPCAMVVTMFVAVERYGRLPRCALLSTLGDASYSLYLIQVFALGFGVRIWRYVGHFDSILSNVLFITFVIVLSCASSVVIYKYVELKISRKASAILRRVQGAY